MLLLLGAQFFFRVMIERTEAFCRSAALVPERAFEARVARTLVAPTGLGAGLAVPS